MRLTMIVVSLVGSLMAQNSQPADWRSWVNRGVQAFKNAQYGEATADFQKAVDLNPGEIAPHLYLATAWMQQFIPGAESPENLAIAQKADAEFRIALAQDLNNRVALASLGSLNLNQRKWDEARDWYRRLVAADPNNAAAYYSMGFIAWSKWYPAYAKARAQIGMKPEDPGPIADAAVRTSLRSQFWPVLDEGIRTLDKALELNPQYDDAMAYMNLFIRERADLRDTKEEYTRDIADADQWVQKTLATKKMKMQMTQGGMLAAPPPPPPPPPPARAGYPGQPEVTAIPYAQIVSQVDPVYPALAQQARVQGTVKLSVTIGADGRVSNIQVVSGHPLLVPAAIEAVRKWVYRPTLLNGEPIPAVIRQDVPFTLSQ